VKNLAENLIGAIDRAIGGKPAAPAKNDEEPLIALSAKVLEISGVDLATKAQKNLVRRYKADYAAGLQTIKTYNYSSFKRAWLEHRATLAKSVPSGEIHSIDAYGETEFEQEHIMKMEAGKAACRAASLACIPVAREIAEEFATVADKLAAAQEAEELAAYARFALKYPGPSPLIVSLKLLSKWALAQVPTGVAAAGCGSNPEHMLPYLAC